MADSPLRVPAREIPIPAHLSPEAQAFLALPRPPAGGFPALDDVEGWRDRIAKSDAVIRDMFLGGRPTTTCTIRDLREGEAIGYELVPEGLPADDRRVYLDIHGGALIMGAGDICKAMAQAMVGRVGTRMVTVDYRMPPDHPYPAGLDDCLAFYKALLRDHAPGEIVIGGGSAGGNLAAALALRIRDEDLPMPAGVVLVSPEIDLTESGDSFRTNDGIDAMGSLLPANRLYAGSTPLNHPYVSALFGDFSRGFPPTFLTCGTRDLFLSNTVRMHAALRAADVPAELYVIEGAPHGNFGGAPDEDGMNRELRRFCERCWDGAFAG